jgi:hypothetical protein
VLTVEEMAAAGVSTRRRLLNWGVIESGYRASAS